MIIFRQNREIELSCGINDDGELFLSTSKAGYNLPNTPRNMDRVIADYKRYDDDEMYEERQRTIDGV